MRVCLGLVVLQCVACAPRSSGSGDADEPPQAAPSEAAPSEAAPSEAPPPEIASPETTPPEATPALASGEGSLVGWWRSDSVCLELFENGDFELSVMSMGPKALVMGAARVTGTEPPTTTLELQVRRIWHARFTGRCRKVHELGDFVDEQRALGLRFEPGTPAAVKIIRVGEDELQLCGEDCQTLRRAVPILGARWRQAGLENPRTPTHPLEPGELLELDLDDTGGHVWVAQSRKDFATVYGSARAESTGPDRFSITFEPNGTTDQEDGAELSLWGEVPRTGQALVLRARRLPRQRLEVCNDERSCATLERQFDAFDHDLR
jgi:hypothetical protein